MLSFPESGRLEYCGQIMHTTFGARGPRSANSWDDHPLHTPNADEIYRTILCGGNVGHPRPSLTASARPCPSVASCRPATGGLNLSSVHRIPNSHSVPRIGRQSCRPVPPSVAQARQWSGVTTPNPGGWPSSHTREQKRLPERPQPSLTPMKGSLPFLNLWQSILPTENLRASPASHSAP